MNILLTGPPGIGKTTIVKKVIDNLHVPIFGFFTQEVRHNRRRIGFDIITVSGRKGVLARVGLPSKIHVGKYSVFRKDLEEIAVPEIIQGIHDENAIIVIDEIGKMEMFSEKFVDTIFKVLDTGRVFGTISQKISGIGEKIKRRSDVEIITVSVSNRDILPAQILSEFDSYSSGGLTSR